MSLIKKLKTPQNIIVIVAALGYFVDIYDLILFSIIRKKSLMGIGIAAEDLDEHRQHRVRGGSSGGRHWRLASPKMRPTLQ